MDAEIRLQDGRSIMADADAPWMDSLGRITGVRVFVNPNFVRNAFLNSEVVTVTTARWERDFFIKAMDDISVPATAELVATPRLNPVAVAKELTARIEAFAAAESAPCPECNGTGEYVGLNVVEPCRACRS